MHFFNKMGLSKPRLSSTPWNESILKAQHDLLNLHATTFTCEQRTITLPNQHVMNVAVANETKKASTTTAIPQSTRPKFNDSILVLIHGWGSGLGCYARVLPHVVPCFRAVYLIDLPGMAASSRHELPKRDRQAALDYFITDLEFLFSELCQLDSVFKTCKRVLAAHSLGAYIATEWMIKSPIGFTQLFLISPVGIPHRPKPSEKSRTLRTPLHWFVLKFLWKAGVTPQVMLRKMPQVMGLNFCRKYLESRYAHTSMKELEIELMTHYFYFISIAPAGSEHAVNSILLPGAWAVLPLCERLPQLQLACTFIYGDRDWMDWTAADRATHGMKSPTRLVRISNAGHNVFVDNAKSFSEALLSAIVDLEQGSF